MTFNSTPKTSKVLIVIRLLDEENLYQKANRPVPKMNRPRPIYIERKLEISSIRTTMDDFTRKCGDAELISGVISSRSFN